MTARPLKPATFAVEVALELKDGQKIWTRCWTGYVRSAAESVAKSYTRQKYEARVVAGGAVA